MYSRSRRRRRPWWISWLVFLLIVAGVVALLLAANPANFRESLLGRLGDERRHQIIALTSSINQRNVDTTDMVPIRHSGINPLGVNTFLEQEAEISKRRRTMEMIKAAGMGWVRQQFPWEDIENPSKGRYWDEKWGQSRWDKYDNIVDLANEFGLQLIARLDLPPKWTHPGNPWPHTPPENFEDYGDFVHTVVSRYKGKVKYYQLWNEPNLAIEWGNKPVDAREYVRLLKIGYQRAKQADPNAVILCAALAPTIEESWRALNEQIYFQQMYDAGAKEFFDIMSVMAYGLRSGPDDRRLALQDVNFSRPLLVREIMVRNGDASKPIWASEIGWNTQPESVKAEPVFGRVSEDLQARYTVRGLQRAAEEWPWMGVMNLWFFKRADDREKDQPFYYFRMAEPDLTPLPVYHAVKEWGTRSPTVYRGHSQENHWALIYRGEWTRIAQPQAGLGQMHVTGQIGASVSFQFHGTDLALAAPRSPSLGKAYVKLDGAPEKANLLPRDSSGKAFIDLSSPVDNWQQQIPVATGLSNGPHRLELEAAGAFALDGILVEVREPFWREWAGVAAGTTFLVILLGLGLTIRHRERYRGRLRL